MSEVILLVDGMSVDGRPFTVADRLKSICNNWIDHYYQEITNTYYNVVKKKIAFQPFHELTGLDPSKKYFYFIPIDHWNFDFQKFLPIIDRSKLKFFAENNIPILFAHDLEMLPNFEFERLVKNFEWLFHMRACYSFNDLKFVFLIAGDLIDSQKTFMNEYFYGSMKLLRSPLMFKYLLDITDLHDTVDPRGMFEAYKKNTKKEKQFTCLTRGPRLHRVALLHGLRSKGFMREGYISNRKLSKYDPSTIKSNTTYASTVREDMIESNIEVIHIDDLGTDDKNRMNDIPLPTEYLVKSYYDLINETGTQYELIDPVDFSVITEKTFKSLYYYRPFMMNGGPGNLRYLKEIGFKTYDFLFDESYDDKLNFIDRHEIIVQNVAKYQGRYDVLEDLIEANYDVMIHNHDHLIDLDYESLLVDTLITA